MTPINKIIEFLIKKHRINYRFEYKKFNLKRSLTGNNNLAKKKLKWFPKKNVFLAADEIYKNKLSN